MNNFETDVQKCKFFFQRITFVSVQIEKDAYDLQNLFRENTNFSVFNVHIVLVLEIYPAYTWTKSAMYNIWSLTNRIISHHRWATIVVYLKNWNVRRQVRAGRRNIADASCQFARARGFMQESQYNKAGQGSKWKEGSGSERKRCATRVEMGFGTRESYPGPFYAYRMHIEPFRCIACMNNWFTAEINHPPLFDK